MIAISTDAPEGLKSTMDKNQPTYTLLSDADLTAANVLRAVAEAP